MWNSARGLTNLKVEIDLAKITCAVSSVLASLSRKEVEFWGFTYGGQAYVDLGVGYNLLFLGPLGGCTRLVDSVAKALGCSARRHGFDPGLGVHCFSGGKKGTKRPCIELSARVNNPTCFKLHWVGRIA